MFSSNFFSQIPQKEKNGTKFAGISLLLRSEIEKLASLRFPVIFTAVRMELSGFTVVHETFNA
jgi:hypothetical protein